MINRNDRNYNYNKSLGMKLQNHSEILSDEVKKCFFGMEVSQRPILGYILFIFFYWIFLMYFNVIFHFYFNVFQFIARLFNELFNLIRLHDP